ncbi:MAG: NAD(P)H-dependent oxidoreductase [Planctomycetota bacterium]|nr:NAD(P)H-dependent oxidoreductase [Planctomycetota bacterium]
MKILAMGASTSSASINRKFANHAAGLVDGAHVTDLDLRQFDLPIYSSDEENANGIPAAAQAFCDLIEAHDRIVISMAEHNGSYSSAFKNLFDWASRIDSKVWRNKPMLILSTSPGARGGATVLEAAKATFPFLGGDVKASFSLPGFQNNFSDSEGVTDPELASGLAAAVETFAQ